MEKNFASVLWPSVCTRNTGGSLKIAVASIVLIKLISFIVTKGGNIKVRPCLFVCLVGQQQKNLQQSSEIAGLMGKEQRAEELSVLIYLPTNSEVMDGLSHTLSLRCKPLLNKQQSYSEFII